MATPLDGPPVVSLPERLDRRLRFGPFPSARDALKFLSYAAAGALVLPFTSSFVWVGIIAAGFAVAVIRIDGLAIDDRAVAFLRWAFSRVPRRSAMTVTAPGPVARRGLVTIATGQSLAIVRAGGSPISYLPPAELARRFGLFRELLRSLDGPLAIRVASGPLPPDRLVPAGTADDRPDRPAAEGYGQLVTLLCRRRQLRRVELVLGTTRTGPEAVAELDLRASALIDRLSLLGIRAARLAGRSLEDAVRRGGWSQERTRR